MISSLFSFDYILSRLNFQEIVSAFIVLFAVIDIFGSTPVIISLKNQGRPVSAWKASSISFGDIKREGQALSCHIVWD